MSTSTSQVDGVRKDDRLLEMAGITKDFAGGRVLHGVDLGVDPGQVHALVGENGAGKSTLMKILAGVYPDYGGEIKIAGKTVSMHTPRSAIDAGVAVIYQEFALAPHLTVADNIALGREARASLPGVISHRAIRHRSAKEAAALDIDLPMDVPVGELSVADQQRTEIVKAVARNARILVMDEPTARLSGAERDQLFLTIQQLARRGVGIVYISHFLEEIFSVATLVTVLRDGRRVVCSSLSDLDLPSLARLMVGDKFQELEQAVPYHADSDSEARADALVLDGLGVHGAVSPTSFTLHKGETIGLAGLQGSGRSPLAEAVVGIRVDSFGSIRTSRFVGLPRDPAEALGAGVALLPADRKRAGILSTRPISDNIVLSALRGRRLVRTGLIRRRALRRLVTDLMARFGVQPANPTFELGALSGGNQQKVIFARAAAAQADVLILDQPTAGVDIGAKVELYEQVDALVAGGTAVLLISDDIPELLRLADSIILMRDGVASDPQPIRKFDRASLLTAIAGTSLASVSLTERHRD